MDLGTFFTKPLQNIQKYKPFENSQYISVVDKGLQLKHAV